MACIGDGSRERQHGRRLRRQQLSQIYPQCSLHPQSYCCAQPRGYPSGRVRRTTDDFNGKPRYGMGSGRHQCGMGIVKMGWGPRAVLKPAAKDRVTGVSADIP
jgi:hypothetical protein